MRCISLQCKPSKINDNNANNLRHVEILSFDDYTNRLAVKDLTNNNHTSADTKKYSHSSKVTSPTNR